MRRTLPVLAAVVTTSIAACSAKDASKPDSAKVAQSGAATTATPVSHASFDPATHVVVIHTSDYAFDAPDSITSGVTIFHLVNDGPGLHHVQLVRLDSNKTAADLEAAMKNPGPPPRWALFVGGPNAPDPHSQSDATLDVAPGNYVILCMVDIPDHTPHFAKGMVKPFKVTPSTGAGISLPAADVTVRLADYSFGVSGALTAGKHTIKVENTGPQPHELEIIRIAPGKTPRDLMAWMDKAQGPPPANAIGGIVALMPKMSGLATVDLTPGNYIMVCFIPDGKDGKPHAEHGMMKEFKVN
jgi:hypothetical protein